MIHLIMDNKIHFCGKISIKDSIEVIKKGKLTFDRVGDTPGAYYVDYTELNFGTPPVIVLTPVGEAPINNVITIRSATKERSYFQVVNLANNNVDSDFNIIIVKPHDGSQSD